MVLGLSAYSTGKRIPVTTEKPLLRTTLGTALVYGIGKLYVRRPGLEGIGIS